MKYEPFTKTVQRFSIRKYSIGAASVFLGSVLFGGGPVQAEETKTSVDQPEVTEGAAIQETATQSSEVDQPMVYAAAASLDTPVTKGPASNVTEVEVAAASKQDEQPAVQATTKSAELAAPSNKPADHQLETSTQEVPAPGKSPEVETSKVSETADPTASHEPVSGRNVSVTPRAASMDEMGAALLTAEANVSSLNTPIDLSVNGFTPNVIDPKFIVEIYGGTYFDRFENNGNQIILRQIDWNKFKGIGFSREYNQEGNSGNYMLWFENPDFYNNIESIKVKTDSIYDVEESLTPSQNNQLWTIPVLKRFVSFPDDPNNTSDATSFPLVITLKDGKTLSDLVGNQAVTFGSTFVSGDNYDLTFNINRIVVDTLNGAWFAADMPNRAAALSDSTVDSIFSDTKNRKSPSSQSNQEVSELLPIVTEDGQVTGFKFITRYELVKGRSVLTEPAGTIPYIVQKLPAELMSLVDTNKVNLYASNAGGVGISQSIPLVVNASGVVNTKDTPAISLVGVTSQEEANRRRQNLAPIFQPIIEEVKTPSVTLSGYYEPAAYTIEYTLKTPLSRRAFAAVIDGIAQQSGASALAETWKERGVYQGSSQTEGIMRNTYSNTYLDRSILNVDNKLVGQMKQADLYEVHYPILDIQIGKSSVVPQTGDVPAGTRFTVLTDNASQVSFADKGDATITLPETEKEGRTAYTVLATYPDGSTDRKVLTINRIAAKNEEADSYNPSYDKASVEAGNQVVLIGNNLPSSANYSVTGSGMTVDNQGRVTVIVPDDASTGTINGQVTVRYTDGSVDQVPVTVQVTAQPLADRYQPSYEVVSVEAGHQVVLTGTGMPTSASYSVTGSGMTVDNQGRVTVVVPDEASTGNLTGQVTVRYTDGSVDQVPVTVQVTAKPLADRYQPSYEAVSVEAGHQVVLIGKNLPPSASYSVTGPGMTVDNQGRVTVVVPDEASTGNLTGQVTVRYTDGSEDLVSITVSVTARPEAEKYNPSYSNARIEAGGHLVLVGHDLPMNASYSVTGSGMTIDSQGQLTIDVPADAVTGTLQGQVTVRYSDGSEDLVPVTIQVTAKPEAEKYSPSYEIITVEAGNQVVLEGSGLPSTATYVVNGQGMTVDGQGRVTVSVPESAATGSLQGQVTVRYSDGSEDVVPVTVQVTAKPVVVPEAEKYSPSYETVTVEAGAQVVLTGSGLALSANYSVSGSGMTVDGQGRVTVSVPESAATGSLQGQVTVRYSDGSEDLVPVTVQVTAKPVVVPEAEKHSPSYETVTVEAGAQIVLTGSGLPSSANYSVSGSGMTVDGQGRVTVSVPENAATGSLQGQVTVRYSDGSEDLVPVTIQVTARPLADIYNPVYLPATIQAGTSGRLGVEGLPETATYKVVGEGMIIDDLGRVTVQVSEDSPVGTRTGQVTITYADSSQDHVPVSITITARPVQTWEADQFNPSYETITVEAGQEVVLEGTGLPDTASYSINGTGMSVDTQGRVTIRIAEDSASGTLSGNLTVTYKDGSKDIVPVTVQVKARPLAEFYNPSYTPVTVPLGGQVTLGSQGLPTEGTYTISGDYMTVDARGRVTVTVPEGAQTGDLLGQVIVTYSDGSKDQVPVMVTVTARPEVQRESDRYTPSYPEIRLQAGKQMVIEGQGLPGSATYNVTGTGMTVDKTGRVTVQVLETSGSGTLQGYVTVTYSDGSVDQVPVTVQVTALPLTDFYNPSYTPMTVEAGHKVILGSQGLPREATYSIVGDKMSVDAHGQVTVEIPVDTPEGTLTGQVTITYSDGSQDQVPVSVQVTAKPVVVPEADKYNPSYDLVEVEQGKLVELPGRGLPEQAQYFVDGPGMRADADGLVSVPVPSNAEVGSLITGQLTIRYQDGSVDLVPISVRVKEKQITDAEKHDPSYDVMEVQAGESLTIKGNNLPEIATYSISGSGMTIDAQGQITVIVPANTENGTLQGKVSIHYPDGTTDLVDVMVIVLAKPVEPAIPESDKYNPSYVPVEVEAGTQVTIPGMNLPANATYVIVGEGMTVDVQGRVTIHVPAEAEAGQRTGQVTVRYGDGSEDLVPITITVKVSEKPVDPVEPEKPVDPVEPEKPVDPVEPEKPEMPLVPITPENGKKNEEVENLVNPGSVHSVQPLGEAQQFVSAAEQPQEQQLPNTGESRNPFASFLAWLLSLIGLGFLFGKSKKEEK